MWRFGYDSNASFILTLALLSMVGTILVWQKNRTGKTILLWFWAAFFGVLVGCAGTFALTRLTDVTLREFRPSEAVVETEAATPGGESPSMGGGLGGGMGRTPRPKRELTDVLRKITLLTGEVALSISPEQAATLITALKDIEQAETMSDDEAQAKYDELLALLDDKQKEQLEAIGLPRGPRPGGGAGAGPGGFQPPAEDANPFVEETNLAALEALRQRFGGDKKAEE